MAIAAEGFVPAQDARLYYKTVGEGPPLLLLAGGDGDADAFDLVSPHLASHFRIVTYDRRGLSRSKLEGEAHEITIERHAEDAAAILAAQGRAPAFVFAGSIGALIGLELVARHPAAVCKLIAFEPPAPELLSGEPREQAIAARRSVQDVFRAGGVVAAMQRYAQITRLNPADCEPGLPPPVPSAARASNLQFFLAHDAPAVTGYRVNVARLRRSGTPIIAAAGRNSGDAWPRQVAEALAGQLGCPLVELAGDHAGFVRHPRALADTLRAVFLGG